MWNENKPPAPGISTVSSWSLVVMVGMGFLIAGGMIRDRGRHRPAGE